MNYTQTITDVENKITHLSDKLSKETQSYRQFENLEQEFKLVKKFLEDKSHRIAFIGAVGVGKTHAICKLLGLFHKDKTSLSVSSGRTTLCEVEIGYAPESYISVEPHNYSEVKKFVEDFSASIFDESVTNDRLISEEVERVIRRMSQLSKGKEKVDGKVVSVDPVKEYIKKFESAVDITKDLIKRINYSQRTKTRYENTEGLSQNEFIKKTFRMINFGSSAEVPLAKKINIFIEEPLLGLSDINLRLLDTKGIDQTSNRVDLDNCLNDNKTLAVFCSRFNDAPDKATTGIIELGINAGLTDRLNNESVMLVLDRQNEAESVLIGDEEADDIEEGRFVRRDTISTDLQSLLGSKNIDITFLNAKEESPVVLRDMLRNKIIDLRKDKGHRLEEIHAALVEIDEEYSSKSAEEAKRRVLGTLQPWLKKAELFEPKIQAYYSDLLNEIKSSKVYASSIRASVNRQGDWYNMDYYHSLGAAARKQLVKHLKSLKDEFIYLVDNMLEQDELQPAYALLKQLKNTTNRELEDIYSKVYNRGRDVYKHKLETDFGLWERMAEEWGKGSGYKLRIEKHTADWFQEINYRPLEQKVYEEFMNRWNAYLNEIKGLMGE